MDLLKGAGKRLEKKNNILMLYQFMETLGEK